MRPSDLGTVPSILEEAARWLNLRGISQWEPGTFSRERLCNRIEHGEVNLQEKRVRPPVAG